MYSSGDAIVSRTRSPQKEPGRIPSRIHRDGHDFFTPKLTRILVTAPAVPVAREVDGDHVVVASELGRDERPPVRIGGAAVHEHHSGLPRITPAQIVDMAALD